LGTLALAVMGAVATTSAHATLQFVEAVDLQGTGLGNVSTILTMQHKGSNTTENGAVFANGAGQGTSGSQVVGINQLRTFGELNITDASGISVYFNPSEPQNADAGIKLNSLVLSIFDPQGNTVFSSGVIDPLTIKATDPGVGNSAYKFTLDQLQSTAVNAVIAGVGPSISTYRLGLSASASDVQGGPETFFAGVNAIPEPSTWAMLCAGVMGVIGLVRRRV
jgi:hypothetical protein